MSEANTESRSGKRPTSNVQRPTSNSPAHESAVEYESSWRIADDQGVRVENADVEGVIDFIAALMRTESVTQIVITRESKHSTERRGS